MILFIVNMSFKHLILFHHYKRISHPPSKHHLFYLPPYSPFLNPLEEAFSVWKRHAQRSYLSSEQALLEEIKRESVRITPDLCHKLYDHTLSFFDRMMEGENIV